MFSQSTNSGFGLVNPENVFRVCDQPHPLKVATIMSACQAGNIDEAYEHMRVSKRVKSCTRVRACCMHESATIMSTCQAGNMVEAYEHTRVSGV